MSMFKSGLKIMKDDGGPRALLAGLGPTTFGYLFEVRPCQIKIS